MSSLRQAEIVDDEAARLVPEHAVDAGDGLHQAVPAHRLVHVHGVQARRVEAGEPHVAHQHDPKRILRIPEPLRQRFSARLVADVALPVRRVRCGSGHDDLDAALRIVVVPPVRPQALEFVVQLDADAAAHANDHGLAVHHICPLIEMGYDVLGDEAQALFRADDGLKLCPPGLQPLLAFDLLAFRRLLEVRVDVRAHALVQGELGQTALVVDRHGRPVLDSALYVVDADVVAEDGAGVGVGEFDGRPCEADERRVRQGIAHVPGEAVDEVVLAAVCLVGDHHDVAAV